MPKTEEDRDLLTLGTSNLVERNMIPLFPGLLWWTKMHGGRTDAEEHETRLNRQNVRYLKRKISFSMNISANNAGVGVSIPIANLM